MPVRLNRRRLNFLLQVRWSPPRHNNELLKLKAIFQEKRSSEKYNFMEIWSIVYVQGIKKESMIGQTFLRNNFISQRRKQELQLWTKVSDLNSVHKSNLPTRASMHTDIFRCSSDSEQSHLQIQIPLIFV